MSPLSHCASFLLAAALGPQGGPGVEGVYYTVDHLAPPEGAVLEVGGMDWLSDGRLAVSTRRGQVWLVENALAADPADARFHLFAEGLQEGLGLAVVEDQVHVLQRGELSRLVDADGDGRAERVDTLSNDWGNSGHYHEFAFGLPRDAEGNFYASFNVSFGDPEWWLGRSDAPYRGWVMKIAPDGTTTPFASGFRSPAGLGMNAAGDLFATDNQGDWMPACPIEHVQEGGFYGHPASLAWTDEYRRAYRTPSLTFPPERRRNPAAVWIPYEWSRSTGNLVVDTTGGKFGPFAGDFFVAEMTNGYVLRAQLEKVQGEYQGAVFPFRRAVGSAVRVLFAPDGTLLAGLTERGWGGQDPGSGIARVRWTGKTPPEIASVHLVEGGFELGFTVPLAGAIDPSAVSVQQYDYDYWWEYGSPLRHTTEREVLGVELSPDRRSAVLRVADLAAGMVARVGLEGLVAENGVAFRNTEFAYTVNQLASGPRQDVHVAKLVPPPPPRGSGNEGVLLLTQTNGLDRWESEGWIVGDATIDPDDPTRLLVAEPEAEGGEPEHGSKTLSNLGGPAPSHLVSRMEFGDVDLSFRFMLPRGGNSGLYLMGRYELQLLDSSGRTELGYGDCGGIYKGAEGVWAGKAPDFNAFRGPGEWHNLSVKFQAPRFDAAGNKVENARFQRVLMDDVLLQDEVEVPGPTDGAALPGEAAMGPLLLQGDHGPVAIQGLIVRDRSPRDDQGWTPIFNGVDLEGWSMDGGAEWRVEGGAIVGSGPVGHLFSPRADYRDLEFRARCRINTGGNSGMYFRASPGDPWPQGYEAQVNSTHGDPVKTGSLYGRALVKTQLIPADTWFEQHVTCRDEAGGVHVTIRVNGVVVSDFLDEARSFAAGHVAFQQHHEGSEVRFRDVEVRELR